MGCFGQAGLQRKKTPNCHKYATFRSGLFNFLWSKILFWPQKVEKTFQKVAYTYGSREVFFLCSPDCPKQPRTSFPFYKFSYTIICSKICVIQITIITIVPSKMILPHCARPMGRLNFFLPCWKWLKCINKFLLKAYTETLCSRKWEPSMYKLGLA